MGCYVAGYLAGSGLGVGASTAAGVLLGFGAATGAALGGVTAGILLPASAVGCLFYQGSSHICSALNMRESTNRLVSAIVAVYATIVAATAGILLIAKGLKLGMTFASIIMLNVTGAGIFIAAITAIALIVLAIRSCQGNTGYYAF